MSERKTDKNDPAIFLKTSMQAIIYIELFSLLILCCSNNSIIKEKKDKLIDKLNASKKDINFYEIILQIGRIFGIIFIIIYFLYFRNFKNLKFFIFGSVLLKGFFLLIYCIDLNKDLNILVMISIFCQGFFHSFISIYFPIWINHFIHKKFKLLLLSVALSASVLSSFIGLTLTYLFESIQWCFGTLVTLIIIYDFIFLLTVSKGCLYCDNIDPDNHFNPKVSLEENSNKFIISNDDNQGMENKMNCKSLLRSENRCAFISIILARAILKFSFLGIHYCIKDYYKELEGNGKLDEKLIYYSPVVGLLMGGLFSYFDCFKKNYAILFISILIGILGSSTNSAKDKFWFVFLLLFFYIFSNLISPYLIEKSFDCFSDRQISEISYVFNCLIYLLIGNLVSSLINSIFETETLMKLYLNVVWFNLIFIFIYKVKMDRKKKSGLPNIAVREKGFNELIPAEYFKY